MWRFLCYYKRINKASSTFMLLFCNYKKEKRRHSPFLWWFGSKQWIQNLTWTALSKMSEYSKSSVNRCKKDKGSLKFTWCEQKKGYNFRFTCFFNNCFSTVLLTIHIHQGKWFFTQQSLICEHWHVFVKPLYNNLKWTMVQIYD